MKNVDVSLKNEKSCDLNVMIRWWVNWHVLKLTDDKILQTQINNNKVYNYCLEKLIRTCIE